MTEGELGGLDVVTVSFIVFLLSGRGICYLPLILPTLDEHMSAFDEGYLQPRTVTSQIVTTEIREKTNIDRMRVYE